MTNAMLIRLRAENLQHCVEATDTASATLAGLGLGRLVLSHVFDERGEPADYGDWGEPVYIYLMEEGGVLSGLAREVFVRAFVHIIHDEYWSTQNSVPDL